MSIHFDLAPLDPYLVTCVTLLLHVVLFLRTDVEFMHRITTETKTEGYVVNRQCSLWYLINRVSPISSDVIVLETECIFSYNIVHAC